MKYYRILFVLITINILFSGVWIFSENSVKFRLCDPVRMPDDPLKPLAAAITGFSSPGNRTYEVIIYSYSPIKEHISYSGSENRRSDISKASIKALIKIKEKDKLHQTHFIVSEGVNSEELIGDFLSDLKSLLNL